MGFCSYRVKEQKKGKVKLVAMDAMANQMPAGQYGIRGFPTIKIFLKGESPVAYDGLWARSDIVSQALDLFSDNTPHPELLQIISEDITKKMCEEHQLCVVAVLPHVLDTNCRQKFLFGSCSEIGRRVQEENMGVAVGRSWSAV